MARQKCDQIAACCSSDTTPEKKKYACRSTKGKWSTINEMLATAGGNQINTASEKLSSSLFSRHWRCQLDDIPITQTSSSKGDPLSAASARTASQSRLYSISGSKSTAKSLTVALRTVARRLYAASEAAVGFDICPLVIRAVAAFAQMSVCPQSSFRRTFCVGRLILPPTSRVHIC